LRAQIADLSKQRASFDELPATPERETAVRDLESELEVAVRELAAVTTSTLRRPGYHSPATRWLLLYAPTSPAGWVIHVLFFLNLSVVIVGGASVVSGWSDAADPATDLVAMSLFLIPALGIRWVAVRFDQDWAAVGIEVRELQARISGD
jgi:hypothetical protein